MKRNFLGSILGLATVLLITGGIWLIAQAKNPSSVVFDDGENIETEQDSEIRVIAEENSEEETESEKAEENDSEQVQEEISSEKQSSEEKESEDSSELTDDEDNSELTEKELKKQKEKEEAYMKELIRRMENGEGIEGEDAEKVMKYLGIAEHYASREYTPYILYENPQNDYERMWNEVTSAPTKEESDAKAEILKKSSFTGDGKLVPSGTNIYDENGNVVDKAE